MNIPNYLVSVYIPTHNRSSLLRKAIESVLNQTYTNLEIIVCDDASSDDTYSMVYNLSKEDSRIKLIKNDISMGACYSRNRCIEIAKGSYITGLDDDDLFLPNRLEEFLKNIDKYNCSFLCSNMIFKKKNREKIWGFYSGYINIHQIAKRNMIGNQIFIKTDLLRKIGGFNIEFPAWQDYDLWYRIIIEYGDCYKIRSATYIMNVDTDRARITTSEKAHLGYKKFVDFHRKTLTHKDLKSLFFQDKMNRNTTAKLFDLINNFTAMNVFYFFKMKLKNYINH